MKRLMMAPMLVFLAACADGPVAPAMDFDGDAVVALSPGAVTGDVDLAAHDADGNGFVCVKTVPEGRGAALGRATPRTIVKDDGGRESCPGGFELTEVGDGGGDPIPEPQ